MAKKKINVRKDYSYEAKKRLPTYDKAKIKRKTQFLILRGPGMHQSEIMEENESLKRLAALKHMKLKFLLVKTAEDAVKAIKDANVWAAGIVYSPGELEDEAGLAKKALQKVLIQTRQIKGPDETAAALTALIEHK